MVGDRNTIPGGILSKTFLSTGILFIFLFFTGTGVYADNRPPIITSPDSVRLPENQTMVITVTATDADGDFLYFSITGGADAGKFSIDPNIGSLSFNSAPDFENPTDSEGNNRYNVQIGVTDDDLSDVQDITVTVKNAPCITPIAPQTMLEDGTLTLSYSNALGIYGEPPYGPDALFQVDLQAVNGTLNFTGETSGLGLTVTDNGAMKFSGTISQINTALEGMIFTSTSEFSGAGSISMAIDHNDGITDSETVNITINDNDIFHSITPLASTVSEGDMGTTECTFTVTRTGGTTGSGSVDYTVNTSSDAAYAANGTDYNNIGGTSGASGASGTINFAAEETSKTITMDILGDYRDEQDKKIEITLSAPSAEAGYTAAISGTNPAVSTITDDDTAGLTANPASGLMTTEAGGQTTFTVVLDSEPTADVTLSLSSNDTTEGTISPDTLTFTPTNWDNAPTHTITVTGQDDDVDDGNMNYTITLKKPVSTDADYTALADTEAVTLVNSNDDTAGYAITAISNNTTEEGGSTTFEINLTSQPTADVVLTYSSSNAGEGTVSPSTNTFTAVDWDTGKPITVTGVNDSFLDGNIGFNIVINVDPATTLDDKYKALDPPDVAITNEDNDGALVINEILPAPDDDANHDLFTDASEDEFVEIANNSGNAVDISGWHLESGSETRHIFPPGTLIPDECVVVVFGGGSPAEFPGRHIVQTASTGSLSLNDAGDTVILRNNSGNDVSTYVFEAMGTSHASLTREPDITGVDPMKSHVDVADSGGTKYSPGKKTDGTAFSGCNLTPATGTVTADNVTDANTGETTYTFTVTYIDEDTGIDVTSIDTHDVSVNNGVTVSEASELSGTNGSPRIVTYTAIPPGGTWDSSDTGIYTISLSENQVCDTHTVSKCVAPNLSLTTFRVNISPPFIPPVTYKVIFNLNDGIHIGGGGLIQNIRQGSSAIPPSVQAPAGYLFAGWDRPFNNIQSDITVTALYQLKTYTLQIQNGSGGGKYNAGTVVAIAANPANEGMIFNGWKGDSAHVFNGDLPNTGVIMPEDNVNLTATYKNKSLKKYFLTVINGTGSGEYDQGHIVGISALPPPQGMIFNEWAGQTNGIHNVFFANTCIMINAPDILVTATYREASPESFSLSVTNGTGSGEYPAGTVITISATPAEDGFMFNGWTGYTESIANINLPTTSLCTTDRDIRITATYKKTTGKNHYLRIKTGSVETGGNAGVRSSLRTSATPAPPGRFATLTAPDPPPGFIFDIWTGQTGNIVNIHLPRTAIYMPDTDVVVIATYRPVGDEVELSVQNGTGSGTYFSGSVVNIRCDLSRETEMFDKWTGQTACVENINLPETAIVMPGTDVSIQAVYRDIPSGVFLLDVVNGTGTGNYPAATLVKITADTPPKGLIFNKWEGQNATVQDINEPDTLLHMPPSELIITATYKTPEPITDQDTDGDGMPDKWEMDNYGDISRTREDYDALDTDGDGYSDLKECLNGTYINIPDIDIDGHMLLMTSASYTLQTGSRTNLHGSPGAKNIVLENGADAVWLQDQGNNTFSLPWDANQFTISRFGSTVTFLGPDATRLVLPATETPQTIIFLNGSARLEVDQAMIKLGSQEISTVPTVVNTSLESIPAITENYSGNLETPDAYLLLAGDFCYTLKQETSTIIYGNSDKNNIRLENGAAAGLNAFPGANTITIEAESSLFNVSRSGSSVTLDGINGTRLILPATPTPQSIQFKDKAFELVIHANSIMFGDQIIE